MPPVLITASMAGSSRLPLHRAAAWVNSCVMNSEATPAAAIDSSGASGFPPT